MQFRVLGPLEVAAGASIVPLGRGRHRALLALLLLNANEVVPTERLVDELWGERPPPTAANILQKYVHELRRLLGGERILTRGRGYEIRVGPGELDVEVFERLVEEGRAAGDAERVRDALRLWRGPPLDEFRYEPFAQAAIARLEEARLQALEVRVEAELAAGAGADLAGELESLVAEHPLRERLSASLMLALYRGGRQADALDVYRRMRTFLNDELGLEPGPELRELERAILTQDARLLDARRRRAQEPAPHRPWRWLALAAGAALVAAAVVTPLAVLGGGTSGDAPAARTSRVVAVDPADGRVRSTAAVGRGPVAIAVSGDSAWVANREDRSVSRLDVSSGRVAQTLGIGTDVSDIAVGGGAVWVAGGRDGTLTRIDAVTGAVQDTTTPAGGRSVDHVATSGDDIWALAGGSELLRIDSSSGRVRSKIPVGPGASDLVAGGSVVWVTARGVLIDIDLVTGVRGRLSVLGRPFAPVIGPMQNRAPGLWAIVGPEGDVWRLDYNWVAIDTRRQHQGRLALAAGGDGIWAANLDGTVTLFEPVKGRTVKTVELGSRPTAIAADRNTIWVALDG